MSGLWPRAGGRLTAAQPIVALAAIGLVAAFLRATTPIHLAEGLWVALWSLLLTVPAGWLVRRSLGLHIEGRGLALTVTVGTGYLVTILAAYFLDYIKAGWLYPIACGLVVVFAAGLWLRPHLVGSLNWGRTLVTLVGNMAIPPAGWMVLALVLLGVAAASPLMAPIQPGSAGMLVDYSYIDQYYHLIRAQVLSQGAPLAVWPDLAGVSPLIYPDFQHFWMGLLARWSAADINRIYFIYAPLQFVGFNTLLFYALGKQWTGSTWGGYLAAALPILAIVPNPYDANRLMRNVDVFPQFTAYETHFLDLRYNLSIGAGWIAVSMVVLAVSMAAQARQPWQRSAWLTLGSVFVVGLVRLRSNFFPLVGLPYGLLLLGRWLWYRRRVDFVPGMVLGLLGLVVFLESTNPHFNDTSAHIGLNYGPFGEAAIALLPHRVGVALGWLPALMRPLAATMALAGVRMIGFVPAVGLALWGLWLARRRQRPSAVDFFIMSVIAATIAGAATVVINAWSDRGGNWGVQALGILPRLVELWLIVPLYLASRAVARRWSWLSTHRQVVTAGGLVLVTLVAHRAATAALHDQSQRAYVISPQERTTYQWIQQNTPTLAVVAAHPAQIVNAAGETILSTNFLSGMTERPAYLQRVTPIYAAETEFRQTLLDDLFTATSVEAVQHLLPQADFDYLLVYPTLEPQVDLACCLTLVNAGPPRVYALTKP